MVIKNILIILSFFIICFSSCIYPKRVGKVKLIKTEAMAKMDSIYMLPSYFTYHNFAYGSSSLFTPGAEDLAYEQVWDSISYKILSEYFFVEKLDWPAKDNLYNRRRFKFRVLLGGTEYSSSDSTSHVFSNFTWNYRAANYDLAKTYLPKSIFDLSFDKPVAIFTNRFSFFQQSWVGGYASVSSGLSIIPDCIFVILKDGEVVYIRNYSKGNSYRRFNKKAERKEMFIRKLFDKLDRN